MLYLLSFSFKDKAKSLHQNVWHFNSFLINSNNAAFQKSGGTWRHYLIVYREYFKRV